MNLLRSRYGSTCRLIAELFPDQIEVVLHNAKTGKIEAIEGVYSNRKVGDASLIDTDALQQDPGGHGVIGPYAQTNWDGEKLRSFTAILRSDESDPNSELVGFLCVNCRTSAFSAAANLLSSFSALDTEKQPKALFENDWRNSVNQVIEQQLAQREATLIGASRDDKVAVIQSLDKSGLLAFRGSPEYVTQSLGMSRSSFYNLLKDSRQDEPEANPK